MIKTKFLKFAKFASACSALILAGCLVRQAQNESNASEEFMLSTKSGGLGAAPSRVNLRQITFQAKKGSRTENIVELSHFQFSGLINSLDKKCKNEKFFASSKALVFTYEIEQDFSIFVVSGRQKKTFKPNTLSIESWEKLKKQMQETYQASSHLLSWALYESGQKKINLLSLPEKDLQRVFERIEASRAKDVYMSSSKSAIITRRSPSTERILLHHSGQAGSQPYLLSSLDEAQWQRLKKEIKALRSAQAEVFLHSSKSFNPQTVPPKFIILDEKSDQIHRIPVEESK